MKNLWLTIVVGFCLIFPQLSYAEIRVITDVSDLDFSGDFVYAVNFNGTSVQTIGDATFTNMSSSGAGTTLNASISGFNRNTVWRGASNLGNSTENNALEQVMRRIIWSNGLNPGEFEFNVEIGTEYRLQLLFSEGCCSNRHFNVEVENSLLEEEVIGTSLGGSIWQSSFTQGYAITLDFTATDTTLDVDMSRSNSGDTNYHISGLTLERIGSTVPSPIASYQFDETEYTGSPDEIIDSIGNFHGQAIGSQPVEDGKVCNALDLSATGVGDYAVLDEDVLTGKTDFTVSLWAKSSKTSNQSILSGAGSRSSNELIMWFTSHTSFRPYIAGGQNGTFTTSSIAGNNWHHLVWTRESDQSCLYVDKVQQGCVSQSTVPLNIQSLILGQEQDSLGGSFSSSQAFDGLIDEILVFDEAISTDDINTIYDNQDAGLGYDGSTRTCPISIFPEPVLDIHFDELDWAETGSIIDISGNDYHANAVNVMPTEGFICRAADLSATGIDDYIVLDSGSLNNRSSFSISLWYKTPKTGPQSLISGARTSQFNELIFWFTSNTRFSPWLKGGTQNITTSDISDDEWHHLVWTRSGSSNEFYRDGVLQSGSVSLSSDVLNITSLILGQEQDSHGGSFDTSQAVEGLIDELLIFDEKLSQSEINSIFINQTNGLSYAGDAVVCPEPPVAFLDMRFDESSWSGTVGEVIDESGNFNGQSQNGANTAQSTPAILGNPGTCGYGTFDGVNDYVALPSSFENQQGSFTITAWINPSNLDSGSRIFADDERNTQGYAFSLSDPGSGKLRFYSRGVSPISVDTQSSVISTDTWSFVSVVHNADTKTREIYVNGVAQTVVGGGQTGLSNTYSGTWGVDTGIASIGGETDLGETGNRFTGAIDEVRMYKSALTKDEIVTIQGETHPCSSNIDHFEIDVIDGQGLTCEPDNITIKACADSTCSTVNSTATDVQLSLNGTFHKTVTVIGSTDTTIDNTSAGEIELSLDQAYQCVNGSPNSCDVTFANAGFKFLYGVNESTSIGNQISGDEFSEVLKLQVVENVNGVCEGIFSGDKDIQLSQENIQPSGSAGLNFTVNNNPVAKYPAYTSNVTVNFSAESKAVTPDPVYLDAGQIRLHAKYNVGGVNIEGNSNSFWVTPEKLVATAQLGGTPINGNSNTSDTKHKAGLPFDFTVTAVNSRGNVTPNYSPNNIQFLLTRTGPTAGGENGTFKYGDESMLSSLIASYQSVSLSPFESGISSTNDASYSEVGLINLDLKDVDYGFSGNTIEGDAIDIGRFYPDHFEQTVAAQGSFDAACNQNTTFAYTGQVLVDDNTKGAISYLNNPVVELTAKNFQNETTKNYTESEYMKLEAAANFIVQPITDSTITGADTNLLPLISDMYAGTISHNDLSSSEGGTLAAGVLHYELSGDDNFFYPRDENSEVNAQDNDIDFLIDQTNFVDSDGVAISSPIDITDTAGINIRFGRAYLANSFGPETSNLPQPFFMQYLNDSGQFVTNTDDGCTLLVHDENIPEDNNFTLEPPGFTRVNNNSLTVVNGTSRNFYLIAPGAGNRGMVDVEYDIYSWLKYDWDWNGVDEKSFDDNPTATATFGLFRGNDRIIYQREVIN